MKTDKAMIKAIGTPNPLARTDHMDLLKMRISAANRIEWPIVDMSGGEWIVYILEGKIIDRKDGSTYYTGNCLTLLTDVEDHLFETAVDTELLIVVPRIEKNIVSKQYYGRIIAKSILTGERLSEAYVERLLSSAIEKDPFSGDYLNKLTESFYSIFLELPFDSMKLSKNYCARLCAQWTLSGEDMVASFKDTLEFVTKVYRTLLIPHVSDPMVRSVVHWMLMNSGESKTVQYLADKAFTNRTHLSERFKALTGMTLQSYIIHVKMYGSMILLLDETLTLTDVLDIIGYKDENHFKRNFIKHVGMDPKSYQKRFRIMVR